ncbi:putative 18S rRNA (guanine-N(7))-methyltransferase [Gracilariopsis chorda]|uniref:Putative 18S rRNA (Guanine-N(7))-methyltransferase n=1 Tax=Gracilariopsis chorda TaxID=448386 RepID=A0A2V3IXP4_9FLOR|nr:putative 18S rRNA (guanine-N(7))-methyltransferase [Gracilariopsis chorda]|eukprot:PXF46833.1 putative 18S rRNA (guanine-N(7))-methyltransferase [Gracilariopsis chorda]
MSPRPEHKAPATELYSTKGAAKYAASTRINAVQKTLAERCLQLLALPEAQPSLLLDIGTGTGLSGDVLTAAGHHWVGTDISQPMLDTALENDVDGDLVLADAGEGVAFRMATFDGAVSVSAIQWLCNADRSDHNPHKRLNAFFSTLYAALTRGARAALQFYPENVAQIELLVASAMRAGFSGGLLVDYPNSTKAKKYYLCLTAGPPQKGAVQPKPLGVDSNASVPVGNRTTQTTSRRNASQQLSRKDQVISKKDRRRRQGHLVRPDSKYTGRKRRVQF